MARATSSLPVPLSPVMRTVTFWRATRPMALYTSQHGRTAAEDGVAAVVVGERFGDDGRLAH